MTTFNNRPKSLLITIGVIFFLGLITNASKLILGKMSIFVVGVFIISLVPYLTFATLAFLINSVWITLIAGLFVLGLDIYLHLDIFFWTCGEQSAIAFVYTPFYFTILMIISFVSLWCSKVAYNTVKNKKFDIPIKEITARKVMFLFVIPLITIVFIFILGGFLMQAQSIFEFPVHKAITYRNLGMLKKAVEKGADIHVKSRVSGETPIIAATGTDDPEIIQYLISKGARINDIDEKLETTPLMWAAFMGNMRAAKVLIENGADVNIQNSKGKTALHYATELYQNKPALVEMLIKAGADINVVSEINSIPLHSSILHNDLESVKILVSHGADIELKNNSGFTALHQAAYYGKMDIVKYLLAKGANVNALSLSNKLPDDYAVQNKYPAVAEYIQHFRESEKTE